MIKCFKISSDSKFVQDYTQYEKNLQAQHDYVHNFLKEHEIEAPRYYVKGKNLFIEATDNDIAKYGSQLKIPQSPHGFRGFKKNSQIGKLFANADIKLLSYLDKPKLNYCIDLCKVVGGQVKWTEFYFEYDGQHYIKIESEVIDVSNLPDWLAEMKVSEWYAVLEERKNNKNEL